MSEEYVNVAALGPFELYCGGRVVTLGAPKQKVVLALLVARANQTVPVCDLVNELWGDLPPASALANLRLYANNLRRLLAAGTGLPLVTRRGTGYVLVIDESLIDVYHFRASIRHGRAALLQGTYESAITYFDAGLRLWRGPVAADLPLGRLLTGWRAALKEERLSAVEDRDDALLRLGGHDLVLTEVTEVLAAEPLRERCHALLIRARYQAGDIAGAIGGLDTVRRLLVEELGIEPGEELRRLQQAILNRDPNLSRPDRITSTRVEHAPNLVPRQLPPETAHFTGRAGHLRQLDRLLAGPDSSCDAPAVAIAAMVGAPGVGKTTLAVHWAHRVADRFPDGQLYVNLRGFAPTGSPVPPAHAVRGFLDALGVPAERIPADMDAQVGLFRSRVAGRRMLIVLDNADQVRPLLPGAPGCAVLVTSRHRLVGLVAVEGAHSLALDVLTYPEARQLLAERLGRARVDAEPGAVDEIVVACGRLPIALAVVAARAVVSEGFPLRVLASELREHNGLDAFGNSDPVADVRSVFSWSMSALSPPANRLFRLLGLYVGPDISVPAAASLVALPPGEVRPLLAELADAHLVTEHRPGRYAMHDLLRGYAAEQVSTPDDEVERRRTVERLLGYYTHAARAAAQVLEPHRELPVPPAAVPGVQLLTFTDEATAERWLDAESAVLLAAVAQAADGCFDRYAWSLAWILVGFLETRGRWHDWLATQRAALAAARRLADRPGQAQSHRALGGVCIRLRDSEQGLAHFGEALAIFEELGDLVGAAHALHNRNHFFIQEGRYAEALRDAERALALYRAAGHRLGEANELNSVGWFHALLGRPAEALVHCRRSLVLLRQLGNSSLEGGVWDSLGYAHHRLNDHAAAVACFQRSLTISRRRGRLDSEAEALDHLGDTYWAAGDQATAQDVWQQAAKIYDRLDHVIAETLRAKLHQPPLTKRARAGRAWACRIPAMPSTSDPVRGPREPRCRAFQPYCVSPAAISPTRKDTWCRLHI
jgi:DNA-binding SARP family transcriptional activator/tetratricopeptide (TPR) repeat protein